VLANDTHLAATAPSTPVCPALLELDWCRLDTTQSPPANRYRHAHVLQVEAQFDASTCHMTVGKAGKIYTFPREDDASNREAVEYARSVGVPEAQLDWPR
jgi:hypothetical protein